jgi:CelD/BcsL family acetyltransferase involved in cellulose biosynthesis
MTRSQPVLDQSQVRVELITSAKEFLSLESGWNTLLETSAAPNIFLTWEWVSTWWRIFEQRSGLFVLSARNTRTDQLVGLAPFILRRRPHRSGGMWRELTFMGCTAVAPDHLDCISHTGWERPVASAFACLLQSLASLWDVMRLDGMTPDSMLVNLLLEQRKDKPRLIRDVKCPFIPLPDRQDDYQKTLNGKLRYNLRSRYRRLQQDTGESAFFHTISADDDLSTALSDLFRLHQAVRHSRGDGGAFRDPSRQQFYLTVCRQFQNKDWLRLFFLQVNDRRVAAALCFLYANKTWFYQTGYDLAFARYGPGAAIIHHAILSSIAEGATEFDLLRGNESYKSQWNPRSRRVLKLSLASTFAGGVVVRTLGMLRTVYVATQRAKTQSDDAAV